MASNFFRQFLHHLRNNIYHRVFALLGAYKYKFPSRNLTVIGVTGTKGKSTTLELINFILEGAGKKTALLSSIRRKIGDHSEPNKSGNTMPGRMQIQKFLAEARDIRCEYALIEVTSQGVLQSRHCFIEWDAAVFTHLEPEHIESHGSFEKYRQAKVDFFRYVAEHSQKPKKWFFINSEARDQEYFVNAVRGKGEIVLFNKKEIAKLKFKTQLTGEFNQENMAGAIAVARELGIAENIIRKALVSFTGVPGRFEFVQEKPFAIIVDYAHTPDSLEKVYRAVRNQLLKGKKGKLIAVLGAAGGGRDIWKRPIMGKIAARYCDFIFLTNEDPFDEDPVAIVEQIKEGILTEKSIPTERYMDRKEAITRAINKAKKGDVVVITGKGSEHFIRVAHGQKIPWNEREVVLRILKSI
ncbi:MAG TPA: UDP-N-acetylmuramoyl-L-alanyl-D-glutamate--2,6-diaminopimelate ligase [Candidatus Paceibacterota bacterium]